MKKKIVSLCLVMALLAISAVGMYAYFTDTTGTATNAFSFSKDVTITLDEANVGADGKAIAAGQEGAGRNASGNTYSSIYPGQTVDKDPTVHVDAESASCYVRAFVTVNNKAALDTLFAENSWNITDVVGGYDADKWECLADTVVSGDTRTYEFRYKTALAAGADTEAIFKTITFPADITEGDIDTISDLKITVNAEAVQSAGFDDYTAAWTEIDE